MNDRDSLSDDEITILNAFRNGDPITRARIMLATMPPDRNFTADEEQKLRFFGTYLECNDVGRAQILIAAEMFADGKTQEEVDEHLSSLEMKRPKAEVIDISVHRSDAADAVSDTDDRAT